MHAATPALREGVCYLHLRNCSFPSRPLSTCAAPLLMRCVADGAFLSLPAMTPRDGPQDYQSWLKFAPVALQRREETRRRRLYHSCLMQQSRKSLRAVAAWKCARDPRQLARPAFVTAKHPSPTQTTKTRRQTLRKRLRMHSRDENGRTTNQRC